MSGYWLAFGGASIVCAALHTYTSSPSKKPVVSADAPAQPARCPVTGATAESLENNPSAPRCPFASFVAVPKEKQGFRSFQHNWLTAYYLAMFADWIQGPYVYALYASYGYAASEIAQLFVAGFASSMIFGTVVGSLTDKLGRRNMCLVYALFYGLSALTKLSPTWYILLLGRLFSGIATSLLYSAFEAWMVSEHNSRGFASDLLEDTFAKATAGNGFAAVIAGLVASFLADSYGFHMPFAFSIVPLGLLALVVSKWSENYGTSVKSSSPAVGSSASSPSAKKESETSSLASAIKVLKQNPSLVLLGLSQALFEGSMYTFVFNWSPVLLTAISEKSSHDDIPFGLIFSAMMVAVMIGSYVFKIICKKFSPKESPFFIHAVACGSFAVATASAALDSIRSVPLLMLSFLVFEACCGAFWPTYGTLRSQSVPESVRASISSLFRVPLNLFVVVLLLNAKALSPVGMFACCAGAQLLSLGLYSAFYTFSRPSKVD